MIKKILIGILLLGIFSVIGFSIFMVNFDIFGQPTVTELKTECDYKGLRKIIMSKLDGNAVTNSSIHISASDCLSGKNKNPELIFIVGAPNIKPSDVSFEWKNIDTLTIKYKKELQVFQKESESKTIEPKIIFEYITK